MKDIRICSVETNGPIKELGNINGPIRKCRLELPKVLSMINNGHVIYELNPENLSERVRLTLTNANPSPFAKKESVNKIEKQNVYVGGIVGHTKNNIAIDDSYTVNTAEQLASLATPEIVQADETLTEVVEEVKPQVDEPVNKQPQNTYSKHDKKNKHKHNNYQNNNQRPIVNNPTVEEKVVKSDF